jgi:hypothetical protein
MTYKTNVNGEVREMTSPEIDAYELLLDEIKEQEMIAAQAKAAKASALNKLANLGLTNDEIAALLG